MSTILIGSIFFPVTLRALCTTGCSHLLHSACQAVKEYLNRTAMGLSRDQCCLFQEWIFLLGMLTLWCATYVMTGASTFF